MPSTNTSNKNRVVGRPFCKGYDARRHQLTAEERQRGGNTTWKRYMQCWRGELALPGGDPVQPAVVASRIEGELQEPPLDVGPIVEAYLASLNDDPDEAIAAGFVLLAHEEEGTY
jgi:hypothetical protein